MKRENGLQEQLDDLSYAATPGAGKKAASNLCMVSWKS